MTPGLCTQISPISIVASGTLGVCSTSPSSRGGRIRTETPRQGRPPGTNRPGGAVLSGAPDRPSGAGRAAVRGGDIVWGAEVRREARDRRGAYGLGTGERGRQAAEIDPRGVPDVAPAVAVAEVGRHGERRLPRGDELEPLARVPQVGR